jgi:hypothetical protein
MKMKIKSLIVNRENAMLQSFLIKDKAKTIYYGNEKNMLKLAICTTAQLAKSLIVYRNLKAPQQEEFLDAMCESIRELAKPKNVDNDNDE